jgi:hypothetical protein
MLEKPLAPTEMLENVLPDPDPNVAQVGACVWDKVGVEGRGQLTGAPATPPLAVEAQSLGGMLGSWGGVDVREALRACDPNLGRHWRYSTYTAAAYREQQVGRAGLAASRIDADRVQAAWTEAPPEIRAAWRSTIEAWLDGRSDVQLIDLSPVYKALRLGETPRKPREGSWDPWRLKPAQAEVRRYLFALELESVIAERMTASRAPRPTTPDVWVIEHQNMAEYYPPKALELGVTGRAAVQCTVTGDGGMTDCSVVGERPEGLEFGRAGVLGAKGGYHLRLYSGGAHPAPGDRVLLRVRWQMGE